MRKGGESGPRNKALMKMFNMIDIGERAGSGIPTLFSVWEQEGWEEPVIEERFGEAARTTLVLSFKKKNGDKKVAKKSGEKKVAKKSDEKITAKMKSHFDAVLAEMQPGKTYQAAEFCDILGVKISRTKTVLNKMVEMDLIEAVGSTKAHRYKLKD